MARENQGLHIALIIFVMLTVILGVTTFMFFRSYEQKVIEAKSAAEKADEAETALRETLSENETLKRQVGVDPSQKIADITQTFNNDMETYAASLQPADRSYRKVLATVFKELQDRNASYADKLAENTQLKTKIETLQQEREQQVQQYQQAAADADTDLKQERNQFNDARAALAQKGSALENQLKQVQAAATKLTKELEDRLGLADAKIDDLVNVVETKTRRLNEVDRVTFDVPDGKVTWSSPGTGTVWINLGEADDLPNLTTFSVYDADISDITKEKKKASIQVIQTTGPHMSEARVIDDDVANPIMPGDLIHTPIWAPGETQHFALTDNIDIDGDGKSDADVVRNLISMAGGAVDASLDEDGTLEGQMTGLTRFLVVGTQHDEKTPKELRDARAAMREKAEELGVRTITVQDLLKKTGWKKQTPVVTYGRGANIDDFRAKPPEGVPRRSTGNLFQPRDIPVRTGRSAF